jgi:hypothetical protein
MYTYSYKHMHIYIYIPFSISLKGIEVDLKTVPLIPGPAETIFLTQGVYFDFASEYLTSHNVRPILKYVFMYIN